MKICPKCGANLSDEHTYCSECGTVLPGNGVSAVIDKMEAERTHRNKTIVIVLAVIGIIIAAGIFFAYNRNEELKSSYRQLSAEIKDTNSIYISNVIQSKAKELEEKSKPFYIAEDLRNDVTNLNKKISDCKTLSEIYDEFNTSADSELMNHITAYRTKLDKISNTDVIATNEYKQVKTYIELSEARNNNKTWGENKINDFKENDADLIRSWSKNNYVVYYYGSAMIEEDNDYDFVLGVIDNDDVVHHAKFEYENDGSSWDSGIKELYDYVSNHNYCVIAVAAASGYYGYYDRAFIYNYKLQ